MLLSEIVNRHQAYTGRSEAYLFILHDYADHLLNKFGGRYVERYDMPIKSGYLLKFVNANDAWKFMTANGDFEKDTETSTDTIYRAKSKNPVPTEDSKNYINIQVIEGFPIMYLGLTQIELPETVAKTFNYTGDGSETDFATAPYVVPGSVTVGTYKDTNKDGKLMDGETEAGTINYETGEVTLTTAPESGTALKIELQVFNVQY